MYMGTPMGTVELKNAPKETLDIQGTLMRTPDIRGTLMETFYVEQHSEVYILHKREF